MPQSRIVFREISAPPADAQPGNTSSTSDSSSASTSLPSSSGPSTSGSSTGSSSSGASKSGSTSSPSSSGPSKSGSTSGASSSGSGSSSSGSSKSGSSSDSSKSGSGSGSSNSDSSKSGSSNGPSSSGSSTSGSSSSGQSSSDASKSGSSSTPSSSGPGSGSSKSDSSGKSSGSKLPSSGSSSSAFSIYQLYFDAGITVRRDGGGYYGRLPTDPNPDAWWESGREEAGYPYLCVQGATFKIQAVLNIPNGADPNAQYSVTGKATTTNNGTITFSGTATIQNGKLWTVWMTGSDPFTANKVQFFNPLTIDWTVTVNSGNPQNAGSTKNPIYVCLSGVGPNPADYQMVPYRTTVHLACSVEGAADTATALTNSFGLLTGQAFNGWNSGVLDYKRKLFYYKTGVSLIGNGNNFTAGLLQNTNSTGRCGTWAYLLYDAVTLNWNDTSNVRMMKLTSSLGGAYAGGGFVINNWTPPNPWAGDANLTFPQTVGEMFDPNNPGQTVYGAFTSIAGLAGQNSATPQEKVFSSHTVVEFTAVGGAAPTAVYDPSYGKKHADYGALQTAEVLGFTTPPPAMGLTIQCKKVNAMSLTATPVDPNTGN